MTLKKKNLRAAATWIVADLKMIAPVADLRTAAVLAKNS
jgi:hypothetical protein